MPRPKSPEGEWVTIPVRLREAHVKMIDAVIGAGGNRSGWMRQAALIALGEREAGVVPREPARAAGPDPQEQERIIEDVMRNEPDGTPRKRKPVRKAAKPDGEPPAGWRDPRDRGSAARPAPESASDISAWFSSRGGRS